LEIVAGGFRNPYDFAFAADGEIFTYDADMEWDIGAPWYRPTRIVHATGGAEFGWRSGWAKWPEYYIDSLPGTLDIGTGSPAGVEAYEHFAFPDKYRGAIFGADWARGRIIAVFLKPAGATYSATSEVFVEGTPLNVTDLAVGPDGALYFCTGGRGTEGGVYRIRYKGTVPPERSQLGHGINRVLRQPQLDAPWAQAQVATVKRELAAKWGPQLEQAAKNARLDAALRVRALDVMQLYGPRPSRELLMQLAGDKAAEVRGHATLLLGAQREGRRKDVASRLASLTGDPAPRVRRLALEALVRSGAEVPADTLIPRLEEKDRFIRFAARRAMERQPVASWRDAVLAHADTRVFLEGSVALLTAAPSQENADAVMERLIQMVRGEVADPRVPKGYIGDDDFVDLLRVAQLALLRGASAEVQGRLGEALAHEYPTKHPAMNRELVRLVVFLQVATVAPQLVAQLQSADVPPVEKLHIAAYAPRLKQGWTTQHKIALIEYYDAARKIEGGFSLGGYVEYFARDFFVDFTTQEKQQIILAGGDWPSSALSVLATLPPQPQSEILADIRQLDQSLAGKPGDPIARLRVGIVAVLARSKDAESAGYLRQVYQNEPDRRPVVAMALTQDPGGENWPILVEALRIVDGPVAAEILSALAKVDRKPSEAAAFRDAIVLGLKSEGETAAAAVRLLAHWTETPAAATPAAALRAFQTWYKGQYPAAPPAERPLDTGRNKWSYQELLSFLESPDGLSGDARRGQAVFQQAQCANCHRFAGQGDAIGPDLTTVARRFHTKEILEAIVYPSHVISDQYASKLVEANGRTYNGMVVPDGAVGIVVLTSDGRKHRLAQDDIGSIEESRVSVMPENLLNPLSLAEVADLFAYLRSQTRVAEPAGATAIQR
jgi:putative heme-binding domain-containing protein